MNPQLRGFAAPQPPAGAQPALGAARRAGW